MKIVYFIDSINKKAGTERVTLEKANYFSNIPGYEVILVVTSDDDINPGFHLDSRVKVFSIYKKKDREIINSKINKIKLLFGFNAEYRKNIIDLIECLNPNIIISTGGYESGFIKYLNQSIVKIYESHFCFNFHSLRLMDKKYGFLLSFILNFIRSIHVKSFDVIAVLTKEDEIKWNRKFKNTKIIKIPNSFGKNISTENLLYPNVGNELKFVAAGRLEVEKGYENLLSILNLLNKRHKNWSCDIYGSGSLKIKILKIINEYGLQGKVRILSPINNIIDIFKKSDLLLMTSRYEGFGMVIIESFSVGTPCISFDCESGPSDIIINNENGFLIKNNDINGYSDILAEICSGNVNLKYMGNAAYESSKKYRVENIMPKWEDLFKGSVNEKK